MAIKKGEANIGIGNIIGSNIYNILLILGVSAIIAGKMSTTSLFGPEQAQNIIPNDFLSMIFFSGIILKNNQKTPKSSGARCSHLRNRSLLEDNI